MDPQVVAKCSLGSHRRIDSGREWIWCVEDLWRRAQDLPIEEREPRSLIDLERDGWFGGRSPSAGLLLEHMRRILSADLDFPVILDSDGSIMDGAHRVCRAILENRDRIKVVSFKKTPLASFSRPVDPVLSERP